MLQKVVLSQNKYPARPLLPNLTDMSGNIVNAEDSPLWWAVLVDQQSTDTRDNTIHQKAIQLIILSGQASYELAKELNDADS